LASEARGRHRGQRAKAGAERSQALVPDLHANIGDAVIAREQKLLRLIDPLASHELVRRFAEGCREKPPEMKWRKRRLPPRRLRAMRVDCSSPRDSPARGSGAPWSLDRIIARLVESQA